MEKKIEIEKIVEKPYDVYIDVPVETIKEIPVPRERVVDKVVDTTVVRPHRREVIENQIEVPKTYYVIKLLKKKLNMKYLFM